MTHSYTIFLTEGKYVGPTDCDGKPSGWGRMDYGDGIVFHGEFYRGVFHGYGILYYGRLFVYEGKWLGNMRFGPGKMYDLLRNRVISGCWNRNRCTTKATESAAKYL